MANYFIGDIQGCYQGLKKALASVEFNPAKDTLWLTGDLIARGNGSLDTLKFLYKHQDSVKTVLGNHDLHFLSVANKLKKDNPKDLLHDLLSSPKLPVYVDWLRTQPLLLPLPKEQGFMSHAGLPPQWTAKKAIKWASKVSDILKSKDYVSFLSSMYGDKPSHWDLCQTEDEKLRFTVNALTRMRFCTLDGELNFQQKGSPDNLNQDAALIPWFEFNPKRFDNMSWIFGHWASLMGDSKNKNIIALDTGYVWGNYLSIFNLKSREITYIHNCDT